MNNNGQERKRLKKNTSVKNGRSIYRSENESAFNPNTIKYPSMNVIIEQSVDNSDGGSIRTRNNFFGPN